MSAVAERAPVPAKERRRFSGAGVWETVADLFKEKLDEYPKDLDNIFRIVSEDARKGSPLADSRFVKGQVLSIIRERITRVKKASEAKGWKLLDTPYGTGSGLGLRIEGVGTGLLIFSYRDSTGLGDRGVKAVVSESLKNLYAFTLEEEAWDMGTVRGEARVGTQRELNLRYKRDGSLARLRVFEAETNKKPGLDFEKDY